MNVYLLVSLLCGLTFFTLGVKLNREPGSMDSWLAYHTHGSRRDEDTWYEANNFAGRCLMIIGTLLLLLLILVEPIATLAAILTFATFSFLFQRVTREGIDSWGKIGILLRRRSMSVLQEGFAGIKELKILGREHNFVHSFQEAQRTLASANRKFNLLQGVPKLVLETMALAGLSVLVVAIS